MITSLTELTKPELLAVAEQLGSDVTEKMTKPAIIAVLEGDGIDVGIVNNIEQQKEDYDPVEEGLYPLQPGESLEVVDESPVEEDEDLTLVKMTRPNGTYQIRGYTFKRDHPFGLVTEADADYLIEVDGGFRMASPREAREYYS